MAQRAFFPDMAGNVMLAATVDDGAGPLTRDELADALAVLTARHPALSAVITRAGSEHVQRRGPPPELRIAPPLDAAAEDALADEPFDLERGPLVRLITDGRRLILDGHHAAIDAWSARNVLVELLELVAARRAGRAPDLPPLASTLEDAHRAMRGPASPEALAWFRDRLAGAPPLHLAWLAPVDAPTGGGAGVAAITLDAESSSRARARAAAAGVTLPAWSLAAWMRAVFDESGQHDIVVRVASGKRTARVPDLERLVGSFADALPVRAEVMAGERTADLARRVQALSIEMQSRGEAVSALDLADALPRTGAGPVGITPIGFSFPLLPGGARVAGFSLGDVVGRAGAGSTRATLLAFAVGERLHLAVNYARSHLSREQAERLAELTAAHMVDDDGIQLPATLHGRVLARCEAHPERVAIAPLTYGAARPPLRSSRRPPGRCSRRPRRGAGRAGTRRGGRAARGAARRRRLRPARSALAGRPRRPGADGRAGERTCRAGSAHRSRVPARAVLPDRRGGERRGAAHRAVRGRVCHVHVRHHRAAQGRGGEPRSLPRVPGMGAARLRHHRRRSIRADVVARLRRQRAADLLRPARRRLDCIRSRTTCSAIRTPWCASSTTRASRCGTRCRRCGCTSWTPPSAAPWRRRSRTCAAFSSAASRCRPRRCAAGGASVARADCSTCTAASRPS